MASSPEYFELDGPGPVGGLIQLFGTNLWRVTCAADRDTFYATTASGSLTWLVRRSISARRTTAIHDTTECPSLSPNETVIAYKKDVGDGVPDLCIAALNLASAVETVLPEE
ncbi:MULTISPECIES: hypothetical protein [unclassified Rathayibacter]|uniref:hypothetical protein n=1 Tax=unclassified Rathayibacter TaxID=2609250 RepID=UPI00104DF157|nr:MULTISPECIES: hypothetical protein [unclassified Rathayibacter]TCL86060.1 hypothetical protein EDF49_101729 [Rathayibacter sp. PhB192]TCM31881.1 hypothetical protein EDF43_101729 [Rathayibacter sp. PhB179]